LSATVGIRTERITQRHIIPIREQSFSRSRIALKNSRHSVVALLSRTIEITRYHGTSPSLQFPGHTIAAATLYRLCFEGSSRSTAAAIWVSFADVRYSLQHRKFAPIFTTAASCQMPTSLSR